MGFRLAVFFVCIGIISCQDGNETSKQTLDTNSQPVANEKKDFGREGISKPIPETLDRRLGINNSFTKTKTASNFKSMANHLHSANLTLACQKKIFQLFAPLLNKTPSSGDSPSLSQALKFPVGRLIDSWGKMPPRVLEGDVTWLGAYDECKRIDDVKYCLVDIKVSKKQLDGKYGTCMPSKCTTADVAILQPVFANLVLPTTSMVQFTDSVLCEEEPVYTTAFYATLSTFALTFLLIVIGTLVDLCDIKQTPKEITNNNENGIQLNMTNSLNQNGHVPSSHNEERAFLTNVTNYKEDQSTVEETPNTNRSLFYKVLTCFSLVRNVQALFATRVPKGAIQCINGIRAISMLWVILGHVYAFGALANMHDTVFITVERLLRRYLFQVIANAYFSVDTFFVLSGLLVAYLTFKKMDKSNGKINLFMYFFHRLIRITPPYLYVILFWNNIFPYTLKGPMSTLKRQKFGEDGECSKYWWTNLIYINNFYPKQINKECLGWSWYLANDMQFYIVAPIIMYFMFHWDRKCKSRWYRNVGPFFITALTCIASIAIRGVLLAFKNYEALMTNPKMLLDPHINAERQDALYIKPYTRVSPYMIGLFLGHILSRNVIIVSGKQKILNYALWACGVLISYALVYGPYKSAYETRGDHFSLVENVVYGSLASFCWAIIVAWVIYACHNGLGGYINSVLSWRMWIPLSRLTFGSYLLHPIVIFYANWVRETPYHYQDNLMVFDITSITVISFVGAFILSVGIEFPIANIEKLIFKI